MNAAGGLGVATEPVRAVTKPEPLPPIGLRTVEQRLGANVLAWDRNVEEDIVEYQLYRTLEGEDSPTLIASLSADETTAADAAVAAGQGQERVAGVVCVSILNTRTRFAVDSWRKPRATPSRNASTRAKRIAAAISVAARSSFIL